MVVQLLRAYFGVWLHTHVCRGHTHCTHQHPQSGLLSEDQPGQPQALHTSSSATHSSLSDPCLLLLLLLLVRLWRCTRRLCAPPLSH